MELPNMGGGPNRKQIIDALRNTAQSASNMVAENASVPVDAIAWALRKAGVPVGDKPVMGSDWMRDKGLTRPVEEGVTKMIGDTIGLVGPLGLSKSGAAAMIEAGKNLKNMPVGLSTKAEGGMGFLKPEITEKGKYLSAKTPFGEVGGNIGESAAFSDKPYLKIHYAELDEAMRGKGIGKQMYQSLIDDAHNRGLNVFSDFTVEQPAVNVYDALKRVGYDVKNNVAGNIEGAVYGANANSPAFQIMPKVK
jgi:predicted GNAT family acetyltransferase